MIRITYRREPLIVDVEGHAYTGVPGEDIVCAAATMLVYTLAAAVANSEDAGSSYDSTIYIDSGKAEIACTPRAKYKSILGHDFDIICSGFELLSKKYPNNVSFSRI